MYFYVFSSKNMQLSSDFGKKPTYFQKKNSEFYANLVFTASDVTSKQQEKKKDNDSQASENKDEQPVKDDTSGDTRK